MAINRLEITTDLLWVATDSEGALGVFVTGMYGELPSELYTSSTEAELNEMIELVGRLPRIGKAIIDCENVERALGVKTPTTNTLSRIMHFAERGLMLYYSGDWAEWQFRYLQIASGSQRVTLKNLPEMVSRNVFKFESVCFQSQKVIDLPKE